MTSFSTVLKLQFGLLACLLTASCRQASTALPIAENVLDSGWVMAPSQVVGDEVDKVLEHTAENDWYPALVPGTVLGALVEAGVYPDPFIGTRMDSIPAQVFQSPWWFKKSLYIHNLNSEEQVILYLDGINYRADIWLNQQLIADKDSIYGAFRQFALPVSRAIKEGENQLLIKIYPPQVRDFYMGFVDWAPTPADHFMGIFRDIRLKRSGSVFIEDVFVESDFDVCDTSNAELKAQVALRNASDRPEQITLALRIAGQQLKKQIVLEPFAHRIVSFDHRDFPQLQIKNPKLWWPNGLGAPSLYKAAVKLYNKNQELSDSNYLTFGIRKIETYRNSNQGRHYKINGRDILIKAAGWVDDLFLRYLPDKDRAQIQYVQDMGLNALRLEGVWANNQHLYDLCDQYGILVMPRWSCQWEWPDYLGLPLEMKAGDENLPINEGVERYAIKLMPKEKDLLATYFRDQVKWLRNHPSILTWLGGSDAMPPPDLEQRYLDTLAKYAPTTSFLISAGEFTSTISGKSGMKMNGPYQYVPPVYWYEDKKLGGAYGFNSEVGPGPQIPPIKSIEKMIPPAYRWPADNAVWNYHSGRKDFASLSIYLEALQKRYGPSPNLATLAFKAQLLNYEAIRPMFEAHVMNRKQAGGVVQWMLNSPWPEFYWQLYDYYLMPNAAYFGTKKALQPILPLYNYHDRSIYLSNDTRQDLRKHQLLVQVYNLQSQLISRQVIPIDQMKANHVVKLIKVPSGKQEPVTFLHLAVLNEHGQAVADNFYWLSAQMDTLDWNTYSWFYTPSKEFANFRPLSELPPVKLEMAKKFLRNEGAYQVWQITLKNTSDKLSFFNELQLMNESLTDNVLPVLWSDNYLSLLPYEVKMITVRYPEDQNARIQLQSVNGEVKIF
ncbi:glycoside hydrolase family 2 protein [Olivibacter jilunii]|uniref:glycoside hydrolase family 2 protein n=1 Tax=Olivibacter jilunii TaxID=985016 RepID=UPI00103050DD|nr:glycoside hydrolase family 2 TIM barrel-domain containing protein [Olivibacter jilunii]